MKLKMLMLAVMCSIAFGINAKEIKTVVLTTTPEMHCANCETRIKNQLKFEKGIKDIVTNLNDKTVTVKYDSDKTNVDNIKASLAKIDYNATEACAAKSADSKCCGEKQCSKEGCCGKCH